MAQWKRVVQHGAQLVKSRRLLLDPSSSRSLSSPLANQLAHRSRSRLLSDLAGPSGANAKRAFSDYASAKSSELGSADLLKFQEEMRSNLSRFQSEVLKSQERGFSELEGELAKMKNDAKDVKRWAGYLALSLSVCFLGWMGITGGQFYYNRYWDDDDE
ncbi:unnamed protein product [Linum tenue]|uniref:Uncharacterized protein n=1 Tax=Linum tenue TaxID=586396 RepID=A0AAV0GQW9_9ROSI|nr:unnamed protein product [Linum tenue]